jgi:hypothetical protein
MRGFALLACGILVVACSGGGGSPRPAPGTGGTGAPEGTGGTGVSGGGGSGAGGFGAGGASGSGAGTATGGSGGSAPAPGTGGSGGSGGATEVADASPPAQGSEGGAATPPGGPISTPPGLHPIFDGKTLDGWDGDPKIWSVKDGAIDGNAQNGGQLIVTKELYDNFRITGTARMPAGDQHLGVCFWGGTSGHSYSGCIDFVPPSGSIWDYGGGNGIRTYKYVWMGKPVVKTEWHQFEILANMTTGVVHMGVDGHEFPVYKDTRLARRKKAVIGLQIHAGSSEVQYKDLAVEVNPTEDRLLTTMGAPSLPM